MVVKFISRIGISATAATMITVIPVALAFRGGADPGLTSAPSGNGNNCTLCHETCVGLSCIEPTGRIEILGAPRRFRPGATYNLTVRISDLDKLGAGFEFSAEGDAGHVGSLLINDPDRTQHVGLNDPDEFITHTRDGVDESVSTWASNGQSYAYPVGWVAPNTDEGDVTFFASAMAINDASAYLGDTFYWTYAALVPGLPGDGDGDRDIDLLDFAAFQRCFEAPASGEESCPFMDMNLSNSADGDDTGEWTSAMNGPTAALPAEYVLADPVRGGQLYDRWWVVNGAATPGGRHPLYPAAGTQSGSTTFRCKECHGWDYKGADGAYGSGSHFTGIRGVLGTTRTPREVFQLLKADPSEQPNGHNMDAFGMSDRDLWDVIRLTLDAVVDNDTFINSSGEFIGNDAIGGVRFSDACQSCHGEDGTRINFGSALNPEFVGTIANDNPWEFLHKIRFSHPGSPMPSTELLRWTVTRAADVGAYAATLPTD